MIKLKHLKEKIKKTLKNKGKPALAMVLCAALILPIAIHGAALTDSMYSSPHVSPGWDKNQYENAMHDWQKEYKPTGMAYNGTWFNRNPNAGNLFPFLYAPYLSIRPGYEHTALIEDETVDFHLFDKRFIYCVASHIQNYSLEFGMQAFFTGEYSTKLGELPKFVQGTDANKKFNFLMLAIACGYPADCNAEDWRHTPDYLVCQTIAWCVTNEKWNTGGPLTSNKGGAFKGVPEDAGSESILRYYKDDLAKYHSSAEYKSLSETFTQSAAPEIYNILHAPATGEAATIGGAADKIDEIFYKVWMAAHLTSKLKPDWEKSLTAAYTTAKQENDGYYHAYVNIFDSKETVGYVNKMVVTPYGDWEYLGLEQKASAGGNGYVMHFKSPTGEIGTNSEICTMNWREDGIMELMPIDETKAKLYTFGFYNNTVGSDVLKFDNAQTYFSSVIDNGLEIYVRLGGLADPENEYEGSVVRHVHEEIMDATYNVNLYKFDSETGKPVEGAKWDILERFDDSQLDKTDLDRTADNPGTYVSGLGSLNSTEWGNESVEANYSGEMGVNVSDATKYNWANDNGSQFERWDDEEDDPCGKDENVTGEDGKLYEIDSSGNRTNAAAHSDQRSYIYKKGYCDGHPAPETEYVACDHKPDPITGKLECNCEDRNQEIHDQAWQEWYAEVVTCERLVEEGGFFHCISTDGAAKKALEEDRNALYEQFISLTYDYSAKEIAAPKGYILHGKHTDDLPIEWRTVTSSEYKATGGKALKEKETAAFSGDEISVNESTYPLNRLQVCWKKCFETARIMRPTENRSEEWVYINSRSLETAL